MEKVLIITYYWPPCGGAGVQRILKFVKYLPEFGIKPYVLTVKADKASYPVLDETFNAEVPAEAEVIRTDTFEPYEIYSGFLGKKSIPTGFSNESKPSGFQKFSRFIRGNFFIPDARKGWIKFAFREACSIIEREKIKTIITTSPPHSVQLTGLRLKKKYNVNWIADLRDPWTDIYYYNEFRHMKFAKDADLQYEKEVIENADKIITVGKSLKGIFQAKSEKINPDKIIVITNGYDEEDFPEPATTTADSENEFIITYTGTLAESYNPGVFFTALKEVTGKFPGKKFRLRFIGNPASSVTEYIKSISLGSILEVIPTVTHDRSVRYLQQSSALLLVIPDIENDKGILTGKLFEYLAARKPIICIGPADGDAAEIIAECGAGKTFGRNSSKAIAEFTEELVLQRETPSISGVKKNTYKKYSRINQTKELSEIIRNFKK